MEITAIHAANAIASLPMQGAWIEIYKGRSDTTAAESLPMQGAWIEIALRMETAYRSKVAPYAGSVD